MTRFEIPTATTPRLRLRAFRTADLDPHAAMQADPEVMRHPVTGEVAARGDDGRTMLMSMGSWALRGHGMWAWETLDDGPFVGAVGVFHPLDRPEPDIAYSLDRPFWGRGYATEAAGAACERVFEMRGAPYEHWVHRRPAGG